MKRPFILFAALLLAFDVTAEEPEKLLEALRSELRAELKAGVKEGEPAQNTRLSRIEGLLMQLATSGALKDERLTQTIATLEQAGAISFSDKVTKLCQALVTGLRERSASRAKEVRENFDATLRSALTQGLKATSAKDVDLPLGVITKLQKEVQMFGYRDDGRLGLNMEALSKVDQVLTAIQDGFVSAGKTRSPGSRDPLETLKMMAISIGFGHLNDIMPRSEFLEGMQALMERISPGDVVKELTQQQFENEVQSILNNVKKLDDLGLALSKIDEIAGQQQALSNNYVNSALVSQLRSYQRTYADLRSGMSTSLTFASNVFNSDKSDSLSAIKNLLVKYGLARVLGVVGEQAPKEEETISTYLQRMLIAASKSSDWQLLSRVLDVVQTMGLSAVVSTSDMSAFRLFLGGVNLERAREFSGAVASYLAALKSGSQVIPVEKIGEFLESLKKNHPDDYEAGIKLSTAGFPSSGDPLMRGAGYPRSLMGPPSSRAPVPSELVIPAVPKEALPVNKENQTAPPTKDEKKPK